MGNPRDAIMITPPPSLHITPAPPARMPKARFVPAEPRTLVEAGLTDGDVERLVLKLLLFRGTSTGRGVADHLKLPRPMVVEALERLRSELLVAIKGSAGLEDYAFQLTEAGMDRAGRLAKQNSYAGVAPVRFEDYMKAVAEQSLAKSRLTLDKLKSQFRDFRLSPTLVSQLGQALNDGRGLFLYGPPGNGKTSISEQAVEAFGETIWIPYTINIDGELVRLFDPRSHRPVESARSEAIPHDRRWVLIHRPTIVVGGELSMSQLDLQTNAATGICEAPVQLRANCGALVVDDFGRQRMPTAEILNRLIVPMEKQRDYLNLPSGRQVSAPFDLLLIFSTNLEPKQLVDEAFLRRIPYKIEVHGPEEREFVELFNELASKSGCTCDGEAIVRLIEHHYRAVHRPLRYCHPRDLLRQVKNFCEFHGRPLSVTRETLEVAVTNYFAGL
ncbi:MAG TPA: AAA family ATPase, partial [Lacipirellulaceae bacterium]|nr:AAA family ATPase [Lacipirellulaceae bacterium]